MAGMGKLDHLEERLRAIEGGEDYAFANLKELFLVPNNNKILFPHHTFPFFFSFSTKQTYRNNNQFQFQF